MACINFDVIWSSVFSLLHLHLTEAQRVCINFRISLKAGSHPQGHLILSNQPLLTINQPRGKGKGREHRESRK
eukprot:12272170-Ditylum_brightwellii.AAC.1